MRYVVRRCTGQVISRHRSLARAIEAARAECHAQCIDPDSDTCCATDGYPHVESTDPSERVEYDRWALSRALEAAR